MKRRLCFFLSVLLLPTLLFADEPKDRLTAMSYNIRLGSADDGTNSWKYRYPASALMLLDQQPDVVGIQEALDMQVAYLREFVDGYKLVGVGRDDGKKEGEYMAILYKTQTVKLLKWGTFWLSDTPDTPSLGWDAACRRTATWAFFRHKATGRKFLMVNTHLDHVGKQARIKGMALILDRIKELNPEGLPVVLTGDFNAVSTDEALAPVAIRMKNARDIAPDTDRGPTYNGWGKESAVIDHIFYSGFGSCPRFEVVRKPYAERTFISDHHPVSATLVF